MGTTSGTASAMHPLLLRQLKTAFGSAEDVPESLSAFCMSVSAEYHRADRDRDLTQRSLDEMSAELTAQRNPAP